MTRDDGLSGEYFDDLNAVVADARTADVFVDGVAERFRHLQEVEARRLLDAEYGRPPEVRKRRSEVRAEAIHRAFARLRAETGHERTTPLLHVAASWGERMQVERQLHGLIASSHRGSVSHEDEDEAALDVSPRRRSAVSRPRRRSPATWEWAGSRPLSTHDHLRLYHVPSSYAMTMSNLII